MELEHEFDLGIPLGGGWSFGNVSGKCTIVFDAEGSWWIEDISVDIAKLVHGQWSRHSYMLDRTKPTERRWYHMIREIIAADKASIDEKVAEELPVTYENFVHANSAGRTL